MPVYKYQCSDCGRKDEVRTSQPSVDHEVPECVECEREMERDYSSEGPPGISFKGEGNNTGFHSIDYD